MGSWPRKPAAALAPAVLAALVLASLLAPWLSRVDPAIQFDPVHGANLAPASVRFEIVRANGSRLLAREVTEVPGGIVASLDDERRTFSSAQIRPAEPGRLVRKRVFVLGTDRLGRDLWSRLLFGGRVSLMVAVLAALCASLVGVMVGSAAVLGGRTADSVLMRLTDAFNAFPSLLLLMALAAILEAGPGMVVLILAATSWMPVGRLARAELLRLQSSEMTLAARATGSSVLRILFRHLLPNALAPITVATALRIGDVLLLEAALSFLGLGIRPPIPSWGNMIADGAGDIATSWWTSTLPGLAIVGTVMAFHLTGDRLRSPLRHRSAASTRT